MAGDAGLTLRDVYRARARIAGIARATPLVESRALSRGAANATEADLRSWVALDVEAVARAPALGLGTRL